MSITSRTTPYPHARQSSVLEDWGVDRANKPEHFGGGEQPTTPDLIRVEELSRHFAIKVLAIALITIAAICFVAAFSGCASTTLHTPIGDYTSTKDTQLDHLIITIEDTPDGGKRTHVEVNGATGSASPVIAAQGQIIQAAIEAGMAAGAKAVVPIP